MKYCFSEEGAFRELFETIKKDLYIDLIEKTNQIILKVIDSNEHELVMLAKEEGRVWAKLS
jgi:hypothetical protein